MRDGLGRFGSVVVLGGGSDIALATARKFVGMGTRRVVLAARRPGDLAASIDKLTASGATDSTAIEFDALDLASHRTFVDGLFEGTDVDLVVLTFGVLGDQVAGEKDAAAAIEIARVNYIGAMSVLLPISSRMIDQGHGTIVVLSSVAAERGRRSNYIYGSSKAGLDIFCQGLADRLHGTGVHLMIVRPGFVKSKMTKGIDPAPLATNPGAVATAIVEGVRRGSSIVWVPSQLRWVMSGLRHLPRQAFRKMNL